MKRKLRLSIMSCNKISLYMLVGSSLFIIYGCHNERRTAPSDKLTEAIPIHDSIQVMAARDPNIIVELLTSITKYPIEGFDPDAQLIERIGPLGQKFMLRDDPWYRERYESLKSGEGYDLLRAAILNDSTDIKQLYSSGLFIQSSSRGHFTHYYSFNAAVFFNNHRGVLYWARNDSGSSVIVRKIPERILEYIDTILAVRPGSHEELVSDGDCSRFITFVYPDGHRNLIYGAEQDYYAMDYDRDVFLHRQLTRQRFTGRKYLDLLIGTVAATGDPKVYGEPWR